MVCFEYQTGFNYKDTGRTLYVADFDAQQRTITNARRFANEEANPSPWFAYPRWVPTCAVCSPRADDVSQNYFAGQDRRRFWINRSTRTLSYDGLPLIVWP